MKLIDKLVQKYTSINEAEKVSDKSKISDEGWHGYGQRHVAWQIAITRYLSKDPKIKKHIAGSSIYFDDTDLVVGSDTVMTLSSKGNGRRETVADMKKAILKSPARVDPNKPAAPGEKKFGRFNVKLPTEMQGAYGGDAVKIENPRAIIKTDLDSAKEIQRTIKAKGVKFRMMKRKDHVAVYIDADDGGLLDAALKKIKRIK
jgi:hypothetical protein